MIELELSVDTAKSLREVLETVVADLRYEINNTDARDYREKLRAKQAALEAVIAKLAT